MDWLTASLPASTVHVPPQGNVPALVEDLNRAQDNRDTPRLWHRNAQAIFLEQLLVWR